MPQRSASGAVRAALTALFAVVLLSPSAPAVAQTATATGWTPATSTSTVRILGISDFGGALNRPVGFQGQLLDAAQNRQPAGGGAYLAATVEKLRDQPPGALLISAGDNIGSTSPENELLDDRPTIQFLNRLGVDASAVGEQEFENGAGAFHELVRPECASEIDCLTDPPMEPFHGAAFPFVATNAASGTDPVEAPADDPEDAEGHAPPDAPAVGPGDEPALPTFPFSIHRVGENRVGVIGITYPEEIAGTTFRSPQEILSETVETLQFLDVNTIVAAVHTMPLHGNLSPGECPAELREDGVINDLPPEIDAAIVGHSGGPATCQSADGHHDDRIVVAPASHGRSVGVIDLAIDDATGAVIPRQSSAFNQTVNHDIQPAQWALDLTERASQAAAPAATAPLGAAAEELTHTTGPDGSSPLADLAADAFLGAVDDADLAIANPDSFTEPLPAGPIDYATLHRVLPYSDRLFTITVTGEQLERALSCLSDEIGTVGAAVSANASYRVDKGREHCEKVSDLEIDSQPVDPAREYTVVLSEFLASAEWVDSPVALDPQPRYITDMAAFQAHVEAHLPLAPPPGGRIAVEGW